jgi:uncharacterized membrane-anchored protein YhcB (DUF1043 family)
VITHLLMVVVGMAVAIVVVGWLATRLVGRSRDWDRQAQQDMDQFFEHHDRAQARRSRREVA